jgi:hypothetical protein
MGFCPYFRQENSSDGMSANFALIAGTLIVRFTLDFLRFEEQWQRPPVVLHFPERSSGFPWMQAFLEDDNGGRPTAVGLLRDRTSIEVLSQGSDAVSDDMKELVEDIGGEEITGSLNGLEPMKL